MSKYLIHLPLPEEHAPLGERIVSAAVAFLETTGQVERTELGSFHRIGRKGSTEVLTAAVLETAGGTGDQDASRARTLEGVMRQALTAAGLPCGEARVFVSADSVSSRGE